MSEVLVAPDRFWREFKSEVAGTLSSAQREEIDRVLGQDTASEKKKISDLRMSFKWFFVRITWGPEKRDRMRLKQEQKMHPPLAARNRPMLASLYVGFVAVCFIALVISATVISRFMV